MGVKSLVKQVLVGQQNKAYVKSLASKAVAYNQWIREKEQEYAAKSVGENPAGGKADFEGSEDCREELVYLISPNGRPADNMKAICRSYFAEHPECMLAYGDEDVWQEGETERKIPWFKPDWSPDLLDTCFYLGSVVVLRRELYEQAVQELGAVPQDSHNWVRQCAKLVGGYTKGGAVGAVIAHIPQILFHCNNEEALQSYSKCKEWEFTEWCDKDISMLSIIIPSKDNPEILENCVKGIQKTRGQLRIEIIVVDNGSKQENKQRIEAMLQQYSIDDCATSYLYEPMEFHFSRMCNLGAEAANGNLLLFLNDDVELCLEGCLEQMATLAARPYTGAVGLKLYYPESIRIQHAGITNLPMGPVHKLQFLEDNISHYFNSNRGFRNVLAVTAACMMVETEKFLQTAGFAEELRVAFNDVDLCFRLYELGYANVCVNSCFAYHHESLSRGDDEAAEKLARLLQERDTLYQRHPGLEKVDPYFSEGLSKQGLDTRIRPAYETAGNIVQKVTERIRQKDLSAYRKDNCVLLRVESVVGGKLQGYGVVLGDDNACYEREILFLPMKNREDSIEKESVEHMTGENTKILQEKQVGVGNKVLQGGQWETAYAVMLEGQYRPDLVENMPDQSNVGLCGFELQLPPTLFSERVMVQDVAATEYLPAGTYQIGMAVRSRVTRLRLMNVSNRFITIEGKKD